MSDAQSRADKLAIAKKKLKEFEARRHRDSATSSPVPSVASTAEHNANNGRLSVNSNRSPSANNHEHNMYTANPIENGTGDHIYQQQPYVINMADDSNSSSHSLSAMNTASHKNLMPDLSNNSSPSPQHVPNGTMNNSLPSYNTYSQASAHSTPFELERAQLQHERDAAVSAYEQVSGQLEQLRIHYTQLHAAYSSMTSNGVHSEVDKQIQQLQSALAVLVEEKTAVQSEMRKVKSDLEQERILNESLSSNLKSLQNNESKKLQQRLQECERLLTARSTELDGLRRSEANAQAQLLTVQHERSEAQARLKVTAREKDQLEAELKAVRKDLHMKEIYLKQLGPHGIVNSANDESAIKALHERVDTLQNQVSLLTNERDQLHQNTAELSRHYETCRLEFVNTRSRIENELSEASSARDAALLRVRELENDISVLQKELTLQRANVDAVEGRENLAVNYSEDEINRKVEECKRILDAQWQKKFDEEGKIVDSMMREKDQTLFEREQTISELQMRLRLVEERSAETRASGSDLLSLSEQLQNEKATVSRAVAQNRELKEQLIETEDRLVALTEEKLQSELARQTAEHQVKELRKKLEESEQSVTGISESTSTAHTTLEAVMHPSMSLEPSRSSDDYEESERDHSESVAETSRERERMLETQLRMANQQLEEIRADLRRSHTRNEEMNQILRQNAEDENQNSIHVELGQAVARIHELAAENQQLRESIERIIEERSQLEYSLLEKSRALDAQATKADAVVETASSTTPPENPAANQQENGPEKVGSPAWAKAELEKRFSQAMQNNAELRESMEKLEHINVQLQLENDTIADHVILYQHQRRLIRERLRAKDEQLAAMEADRKKTMERCQELQKALMDVLSRTGALKEYEIGGRSRPSRKPRKREARSYSHSTVDEFSGDEDVIVNGSTMEIPPRTPEEHTVDESALSEEGRCDSVSSEDLHKRLDPKPERSALALDIPETDAAVRRILQIITDISKPPHPSAIDKLHCTQCIGDIQTL